MSSERETRPETTSTKMLSASILPCCLPTWRWKAAAAEATEPHTVFKRSW